MVMHRSPLQLSENRFPLPNDGIESLLGQVAWHNLEALSAASGVMDDLT